MPGGHVYQGRVEAASAHSRTRRGVALALVLLFQSRATTLRHHAVPYDLEVTANVVGFAGKVRYFPRDPGDIKLITKEFVDSWEVEKAHLHRQDLPPASYLAISGG